MYVVKRNGNREEVQFDKIVSRIKILCFKHPPLDLRVDYIEVSKKVIQGVNDGIKTSELDTLSAETAVYLSSRHPDYNLLAGRIAVSNLQKNVTLSFVDTMIACSLNVDETGAPAPLIHPDLIEIFKENKNEIHSRMNEERDFMFDYFGFRTLERSYLLRVNGNVVETPQYMFMRVAFGIHKEDVEAAFETYDMMSTKAFIHATPTLFNASSPRPQMASCFLLAMKDDSLDSIFDTMKDCAMISKTAGGIGLSIQNVRASGSYIAGTGGHSNGIVPMLRCFNNVCRYVDQGGGKRSGSCAVYIEPHHPDIFDFLELRKNHGKEEMRARDLFLALWVSDLFFKRVEQHDKWTLFCPKEAPGLCDVYGDKYTSLYERYEKEGRGRKVVYARDLWHAIVVSIVETGTPYMLSKDSANAKSNQKQLGTIRSSNLCAEIIEYSSKREIAVCNLASIGLPSCVERVVDGESSTFSFKKLEKIVNIVTRNLNKVIDGNYYPLKETKHSNLSHRPIGIGVQGLADVFMMMGIAFDSDEAKELNKQIFETIYYAALTTSNELAMVDGHYDSFMFSPLSFGQLQFDLWDEVEGIKSPTTPHSIKQQYDWKSLRQNIGKFGVRNSLLVALMPTASTSQILGYNECFEPYTSNIYVRRVKAGEFPVVNKHLVNDLRKIGMWTDEMRNEIIANGGSVQTILTIPQHLRDVYKTVWEIKQKDLIDMSADRARYVCQSQSFNLYFEKPKYSQLSSAIFYAWKKGLKTLSYYCHTKPAANPIQFTVDTDMLANKTKKVEVGDDAADTTSCSRDCLSCSS